ncbi:hypothetical protein [Anabaena sp. CCY 0017]|uniref:hypothetical protein n=1 Tax=Anabaena sp. CCY 0017 TaxID=3103866 RepID=UPI0039C5B18A
MKHHFNLLAAIALCILSKRSPLVSLANALFANLPKPYHRMIVCVLRSHSAYYQSDRLW